MYHRPSPRGLIRSKGSLGNPGFPGFVDFFDFSMFFFDISASRATWQGRKAADSILRANTDRSAPLRIISTRTDAPKPHLTIFRISLIFLSNSSKQFLSAAGGGRFQNMLTYHISVSGISSYHSHLRLEICLTGAKRLRKMAV